MEFRYWMKINVGKLSDNRLNVLSSAIQTAPSATAPNSTQTAWPGNTPCQQRSCNSSQPLPSFRLTSEWVYWRLTLSAAAEAAYQISSFTLERALAPARTQSPAPSRHTRFPHVGTFPNSMLEVTGLHQTMLYATAATQIRVSALWKLFVVW